MTKLSSALAALWSCHNHWSRPSKAPDVW